MTMEQTTNSLVPWLKEPCQSEPTFVPPKAPYPWRRYFARGLDFGLIQTVYQVILAVFLGINFSDRNLLLEILDVYLCWGLVLLLEPFFLAKWGKTPGKWLFGLSVRNKDGDLLTRQEAFDRTKQVFFQGEGYGIPFYNLYRNYQSYKICRDNGVMEWDKELRYEAKPFRSISVLGYLGITAATVVLMVGIGLWQMTPPNKGILTTAELAENYNHQLKYFKFEDVSMLTPDGKWIKPEQENYTVYFSSDILSEPIIEELNGNLASFSFTIENTEGDVLVPSAEKTWLTAALLRTQIGYYYPDLMKVDGHVTFSDDAEEQVPFYIPSVMEYIEEHPYCAYVIETGNLRISQEVTLIGYEDTMKHYNNSYLFPVENAEETYCSLTFTLEQRPELTSTETE